MANARVVTSLILALSVTVAAAQEGSGTFDDTTFDYQDVFDVEYVSDPQVAPDGNAVVYQRMHSDVMKDRRRAHLWHINADGSAHRPLTGRSDNESSPRWSPDGSRIAFISPARDGAEIWLHWMGEGRSAAITQLPRSPSQLQWSPDGEWLAFVMQVPASPEPLFRMPSAPEGADWAEPARVVQQTVYQADGVGDLKPGFQQLFVVPADGGSPRQLTRGEHGGINGFSWQEDADALIFSSNRNDNWDLQPQESDLFQVTISDRVVTRLLERPGPDNGPTLSPDGRYLAWLGFVDQQKSWHSNDIYLREMPDGEVRNLTGSLDRSAGNLIWADDSRHLHFTYHNEGDIHLARVDFDGDVQVVAEDLGSAGFGRPYAGGDYSAADGVIAYTANRDARPAELAVKRGRSEARIVTDLNRDLLSHTNLAELEEFWFESSADGRRIQGWVAKPPGFDPDQQYPLILEIHGGPHTTYGPHFSEEIQLFASQGYVVLYTNPRGSTSYGEEFAQLIDKAYPSQDYDDLMSGVDAVLERGYVDPDRLYVTGGSGGGVLTAWIIGKTDRFRAAVVAKPVIDWASFVLTADFYPFFTRNWFTAPPWEDYQQYWERSPLSLVGNVSTPTMLLTGEEDRRTPISQSEEYYQALRLRGVEAVMVRIPGAFHGIAARPSQLISKAGHILAWFDRHGGSSE